MEEEEFEELMVESEPQAVRHSIIFAPLMIFCLFMGDLTAAFVKAWQTAGRTLAEHDLYRDKKRDQREFEKAAKQDIETLTTGTIESA